MLSTLLIRNKDFKKYPGFFLAPLCQCEFGIFEVFLQLIQAESDEFRRRRVRFLKLTYCWRSPNCTRGGRTSLIFLTRQKVYLTMNSIYSIMPYRLLKMREEEDSWSRVASLPDRIREKVWLGELIVSALQLTVQLLSQELTLKINVRNKNFKKGWLRMIRYET